MSRKLFLILPCILLLPALLFAQTGKIKGQVVDRETGDALPGANIVMTGSSLGAAANINGEFFILNVQPGEYELRASFIGYRDVFIKRVIVNVDLSTTINFQLPSEALEVAAISIVAERPLVNKSATNAVRITTAEDIAKLPIRGTQAVFGLQPGVTVQDGNLFIRGGRLDEVGFFVEGSSTRNILTGSNAVNLIPEALEEVQIQAGGYNAEYGGANAGIITQTLRSGSNRYHARLQAETDQWPGQNFGDKRLDTYSYGYSDLVLTLSGPVMKNKIKFFVAGQRTHFDDSRQVFWTGVNLPQEFSDRFGVDQIVDSGERGGKTGDPVEDIVLPDGNIDDPRTIYNVNGTLSFDYNPILLRLSASTAFQEDFIVGARPFLDVLSADVRRGKDEQSNNLFTAKLTHLLSPSTFYALNVSYFDRRRKTFEPAFGDNYLAYGDSIEVARAYGAAVADDYRQRALGPANYDVANFPFSRPGERRTAYLKEKQNYISANLDFTTQYKNHEIKFGGSVERWTVRRITGLGQETQFNLLLSQPDVARALRTGPSDPGYENAILTWRRARNTNAYGYDVLGNEVDDDSELFDAPKKPVLGAVYLQDKFEVGDLVINAGVRFDYFNFDQRIPADLANPEFNLLDSSIPQSTLTDIGTKTEISPRLGFAFPVTDRTVFHVQYGRFVQAPQFSNVYSGRGLTALIFGSGNFVANPGIAKDLDPITTVQYEIGFNQALNDFTAFDLTAFYRDVKGQLQITKQITDAGATAGAFNIFQNQDFATTKGLELSMTFRRTQHIAGFISYTFSNAQGTGSFPNSSLGAIELEDPVPTIVTPLDFSQKHRGSISFDYRFARGEGGPILERSGINLLTTFNSGHPYTRSGGGVGQQGADTGGILNSSDPRGRTALEGIGASTTPWVTQLDLRVDKTVSFGRINANFYVYAQNLLNTKNVVNVYQRTGNATDDGFLTNPDLSADIIRAGGDPYVFLYNLLNLENRQHWWVNNTGGSNEDLFGRPRQIRFGVSVEY